jgi:hypothetical protein
MTTLTPITLRRRDEGPNAAMTPVSAAFINLVGLLETAIAAERGVLDADAEGFHAAQASAESAGERLAGQCAALLALPDLCATDRALRTTAFLLQTLLSTENDDDRRFYSAQMQRYAKVFETFGDGPTARIKRSLQRCCMNQIAVLMRLRDAEQVHHDAEAEACAPGPEA